MIPREEVERLKSTVDISDFISRCGISLKSAGSNTLKGLCPFHDEKSPSFSVRPAHGTYHCFGCGVGGDIFTFAQEYNNLSFRESILYVADMFGITVVDTDEDEDKGPSRKQLHEVMKTAFLYYEDQYNKLPASHPAKKELEKRDLHLFASSSGVGYAPEGWTHLYDYLKELNFTDEIIASAGLSSVSERGTYYDFFRGRLLWSIKDVTGKVIGFGARRLFDTDKNPGKYINTPETPIYHKSEVLYNLDVARTTAAREKVIYVVEGYTDVMAYRAAGIHNVVASCGTAFGEKHASILRRLVGDDGQIIFCFDGDAAGMKAARKTFELKTPIHQRARAVVFEEGDPCDIRLALGNDALLEAVSKHEPLMQFVLRYEMKTRDLTSPEGRSEYLKAVIPLLASINDASLREDYKRKVTLWSGSTLNVVSGMVSTALRSQSYDAPPPPPDDYLSQDEIEVETSQKKETLLFKRQLSLLGLIYQYPHAFENLKDQLHLDLFDHSMQSLGVQLISLLDSPEKVLHLNPDSSKNPAIAHRALNEQYAAVQRAVRLGQDEVVAGNKVAVTLIDNIRSLQKQQEQLSVKMTIASTLNGHSDDLSILEEIEKMHKSL